ncbi:MAG TPA: helix-turn-helix transcriptional regulator [Verrucomicrobiae bacterium]|nr:helix-turn-helix transcriptional regulator [Verrucomicrobiae bacterium]
MLLKTQDWERVAREAEFKPQKMASLCSVSERHLQRVFKKYLHCTPSHWLRELQCKLARQLIAQGYSSKAAAAELKFSTDAHFCREFKKFFGVPPQSFAPNHVGYLKLSALDQKRAAKQRPDLLRPAFAPVR